MDLTNKVVIITGGGSGIGKATAFLFMKEKASVVICGRRQEPLQQTGDLIRELGGKVLAIQVDVRDSIQIRRLIDEVIARFGRIDVLINNAGVALAKPFLETSEEEWEVVLDTNLKGIFVCSRAVLPEMMKTGEGVIINVSSVLGRVGRRNFTAYCASKFGVIGFTQSLADEMKEAGLRIYAVCPGPTYTDLHCNVVGKEFAKGSMAPEYIAQKIVELVTSTIELPSGGTLVVDKNASHQTGFLGKIKEMLR